uniref:SusD/RagB family nutrient-binding outer membrane lipoprotein n=1 Tax=uncultured Draconibacterium sp. TaxID=1573823 RepID=UPI0032170B5B
MNFDNKIMWFAFVLLLLVSTACDEEFEKINTNPNAITEIDAEYLFANATLGTLRGGISELQFTFGAQYAHLYVGRNNRIFIDRYYDYFENDSYKYVFENFYQGPIRLLEEAKQLTQTGGKQANEVRYAMAQLMAMVNYARLADNFGAVPYHQGGIGQTGVLFPEYDSVEEIYTSMLNELEGIITLLASANPEQGFPNADPLFDNDLDKWSRFANSFRLRLAMRIRFKVPELANPIIQKCLALPLIEGNSQNAWNENQDSDVGEFSNPIYGSYNYWQWGMSELLIEKLKATQDPRLPVFAKPNVLNGEYTGVPNGLSDDELLKWGDWKGVSKPNDMLVGRAAPIFLMAAAEVYFLKAEAALFDIVDGDANELYQMGIRKSFEQWGVAEEQIEEYITNVEYAILTGTQEEKFEQISTQLWISFLSNETEAWANLRRTGYPELPARTEPKFSLGVTGGVLPTRLKYPSTEVNINNANYLKAIEEQGADEISTPLWWDVRN